MYKKIMLSLLLLFSSNTSYCYSDNVDAAIVAAVCSISLEIVRYGQSGWRWWYPSDEDKARTKAAQIELVYLTKKNEFIECLGKTQLNGPKNDGGVPTECEAMARAFIHCGGINEVFNMTRDSRDFGQQK